MAVVAGCAPGGMLSLLCRPDRALGVEHDHAMVLGRMVHRDPFARGLFGRTFRSHTKQWLQMADEADLIEAQVRAERRDWTRGWQTLTRIDPNTEMFVANGREYRVHKSVSFDRYEAYEILQVEIGLSRTFAQFQAQINEAYGLCNQVASGKPVFADLAILLRDMMIGASLVGERQTNGVLRMCALFINREGEDIRYIDEALIESKVEDWRIEGVDMSFFFQFALRSIPGFFEAYKATSLDTSSERNGTRRAEVGTTSRVASSG